MQNQTVCTFDLSQNTLILPGSAGGNFTVNITAPTNCDYSATSNFSWITVTNGNPGTGNGTVSFTVATAPNDNERIGTISIGGKDFNVLQGSFLPPVKNSADCFRF